MAYLAFLILAVLLVAYANGANDNFKGVATLFGSGTSGYRGALGWGTAATFAGSMAALFLAEGLVTRFSGRGLVPDVLVGSSDFVGAVALGTALTVLLATLLSFPISTTHALTGGLVGAGLVLGSIRFSVLGAAFFLPLILSPLAAMALVSIVYPAAHWLRLKSGIRRETCICVNQEWVPVATPTGSVAAAPAGLEIASCEERYQGTILSMTVQNAVNGAHYLSAGAVSFARGLNDTPKIVALLIAAQAMNLQGATALIGLAMAMGAVLHARKVAETLSHKITPMNHGQGFSANLVTAVLVILASRFQLAVSTTHVSCGALFGIGALTRQARLRTIGAVLLAWGVTLPVAAGASALAALALR